MKPIFTILICLVGIITYGQRSITNITTPPNVPQIRTMAEWEEIEGLIVTWTRFKYTLKEIISYAKKECRVYVICDDASEVITYLNNFNVDTVNITFIEDDFNSVWIRDYGATSIYANNVDSLFLVDWIYNRNRPHDDTIPRIISRKIGVPLYVTTNSPYDLVNTGGNFMSDGIGTAFSSKLILEENGPLGIFNPSIKTEQDIDSIMKEFMGIDRYIKMDILPYDGIHHIDMHMKLLNEETLLVGEYPPGEGDGPMIEANLQYILDNYNSSYGTPYRVVRIPMPPDECGRYPDDFSSCNGSLPNYGYYRTYTNLVFVNKTVLVPTYDPQYDSIAFNILKKELPGYKLIGIDCNHPIRSLGALHCITRAVGSKNQLYIAHQPIRSAKSTSANYIVNATIRHKSGIQSAQVYYTTDTTLGFQLSSMIPLANDEWQATIPTQALGTTVYYYINAIANSGKSQNRPMPAPKGTWTFEVTNSTSTSPLLNSFTIESIFPNPSDQEVTIPIYTPFPILNGRLSINNVLGQEVSGIHEGLFPTGRSIFRYNVSKLAPGTYFITLDYNGELKTSKLIVK